VKKKIKNLTNGWVNGHLSSRAQSSSAHKSLRVEAIKLFSVDVTLQRSG